MLRLQFDHVKELMVQTTMSLLEIAVQSGFNDQAAFTHTFQQLVGCKSRKMATALHDETFRRVMRIFQSFQ